MFVVSIYRSVSAQAAADAMSAVGASGKMVWDEFHGKRRDTYLVNCGNLGKYLKLGGVTHIDLWSLDVEGSELRVMQSFDWDHIHVGVVVIEQNPSFGDRALEANRSYLRSRGFVKHSLIGEMNEFWVNNKYFDK